MFHRTGWSRVEILIALAVLGLVATFALPRFGRAAQGPDDAAQLRERLKVLRIAIERYYQDHDAFPATRSDGRNPAGAPETFAAQLLGFTDADGIVSEQRSERFCYGPYLRDGVPPCPVGALPNLNHVRIAGGAEHSADPQPAGWRYNPSTGMITADTDAVDTAGRPFATY